MKKKTKTETFISVGVQKTQTRDVKLTFDSLTTHPEPEKSAVPVGQNMFYQLKRTKDERFFDYVEEGIGEFYKKGKDIFFRREHVFMIYEGNERFKPFNGNPPELEEENSKFILLKFLPQDYTKLLASPNSVLCSTDPFTPTPVELQNNTLLGKLDNLIQSIDQNELWSILLQNNKKPVEGSIRYNKKQKCFQGYDGKQWRTLMWGEE